MSRREPITVPALLQRELAPLDGVKAVDIGAGTGTASRLLAKFGASVLGIEPQVEAVETARSIGGGPVYRVARGETTGLEAASAGLVVFSFSLHHCADPPAALAEAMRILRDGGRIAVLEPEAEGVFQYVSELVDDETGVLATAQRALEDAGSLVGRETVFFEDTTIYASAEELIRQMTMVDPDRVVSEAARAETHRRFVAHGRAVEGGFAFPYFGRLDILRRCAQAEAD